MAGAIGGAGGAIGGSFGTFFGGQAAPIINPYASQVLTLSNTISASAPTATIDREITPSVTPTGTPYDLSVLSCNGALAGDSFPPGFFRSNFTNLADFCTLGCACSGSPSSGSQNTTKAKCDIEFNGVYLSNFTAGNPCSTNCSCISPNSLRSPTNGVNNQVSQAKLDSTNNGRTTTSETYFASPVTSNSSTCPKGPFPAGNTSADYPMPTLFADISCFPPDLETWTLVPSGFNYKRAQLCLQCPGGYGPDPSCIYQPLPLPGPCCQGGTCRWISDEETNTVNATLQRGTSTANVFFYANGTVVVQDGNNTQVLDSPSPSGTSVVSAV
ncbi:MAG: hypothetical protein M1814_004085 [Vezdaea aestivalis]|nr:MAG: hypothetical protein M1814_004085 [Vezdaea aestivalis]